jgi:L-rhamnose mutarotase
MHRRKKYAWTWKIKKECMEEHVKMHLNPWPEVLEELRNAGMRNYSIFQEGERFFYCFECDDVDKAFNYVAKSETCQKWDAITSKMVEGSFDYNEDEPIKFMREVFYLE